MKSTITLLVLLSIMISCNRCDDKEIILLADREAPLGWVFLRIYNDNTFEFESRGLERRGDIYSGEIEINNDTIYFRYSDSIPKAGNKAVLTEGLVSYFNGSYSETLEIKKNELKMK